MAEDPTSAADFLPDQLDLEHLRAAADRCRGCPLYGRATQTVFGAGPPTAKVVLVGEQPGDQEDLQGHPFVGPAGQLLNDALEAAQLPRDELYITNAVKHFKWEPRGKRRLHKKPNQREIDACNPWLAAELQVIQPQVLVCLGVTAATAAFGKAVRLKDYRGSFTPSPLAQLTFVTTHPSSLLRLRGRSNWDVEFEQLVGDFRQVRQQLSAS